MFPNLEVDPWTCQLQNPKFSKSEKVNNILIKAGVILKVENDEEQADSVLKEIIHQDTKDSKKDYKNKTTEELQKLLKIAVLKENYENAALIRDEISKRQ